MNNDIFDHKMHALDMHNIGRTIRQLIVDHYKLNNRFCYKPPKPVGYVGNLTHRYTDYITDHIYRCHE